MIASTHRNVVNRLVLIAALFLTSAGCRQKMAEQPYYRPYDATDFFEDGRSERPLERGVIHRAQYLETDPLVTGLTREEWGRIYSKEGTPPKADLNAPPPIVNRDATFGAPRFDPPGFDAKKDGGEPHPGPAIYAQSFPFEIKKQDLKRGEERFTIYCAVCHGPLGNGQGKIWERGYLTPTSFHTTMVGDHEIDAKNPRDIPLGYSRGYAIWGIKIPLRDVPVGYIFEVVTKGYGGMPNYAAQIAPADRWRIIAYVRALQLSQYAPDSAEVKALIQQAGGKS
jgi:mono/diheme cytochrome c family protein